MGSATTLRVALVAPPWYQVPPDGYGGIEQIVGGLAAGLSDRGHDVTLLAAGDDRTSARLIATFDEPPEGLGTAAGMKTELVHAIRVAEELDGLDIDIVHDHTNAGPAFARERDVPTVVTVHGPIDDATAALYEETDVQLVAISEAQRGTRPGLRWIATVPNGIDVDQHPFSAEKGDYFLFLGRISPDKGVAQAIEVARTVGMPLVIAAKCEEPSEQAYLEQEIKPLLGAGVRYLGPVETSEKFELLTGARALLFPIQWEEPFGLVMIESMACGTPVIATERGSVREIVVDGVTGFIRDDLDGLVDAARRIDGLSPRACREHVRDRFDTSVMVDAYERVYRDVLRPR